MISSIRYYHQGKVYASGIVAAVKRYGGLAWLRLLLPGFRAEPGQFIHVVVYGYEAVPMSVAWVDNAGLELIVRPVGETTRRLYSAKVGDVVGVVGPMGRSISTLLDNVESVVLVGGGSGVAPILYSASWLLGRTRRVYVILGFRDEIEAGIREVFESKGVRVHVVCEKGGGVCDEQGLVTESRLLRRVVEESEVVIAAGPKPMLCALYKMIGAKLLVFLESIVKCGLGFCGSCRLWEGGPLLCRDGPVFRAVDVSRVFESCTR